MLLTIQICVPVRIHNDLQINIVFLGSNSLVNKHLSGENKKTDDIRGTKESIEVPVAPKINGSHSMDDEEIPFQKPQPSSTVVFEEIATPVKKKDTDLTIVSCTPTPIEAPLSETPGTLPGAAPISSILKSLDQDLGSLKTDRVENGTTKTADDVDATPISSKDNAPSQSNKRRQRKQSNPSGLDPSVINLSSSRRQCFDKATQKFVLKPVQTPEKDNPASQEVNDYAQISKKISLKPCHNENNI